MDKIFKYENISSEDWDKFIDLGKVSDKIINSISLRIKNNNKLTEREMAIFYSKTSEINETIIKLKSWIKTQGRLY